MIPHLYLWIKLPFLGRAEESFDHPFRSYGFRPLPPYSGGWAEGRIQGDVDPPEGKLLQVDPVQLISSQIDAGMSGAAVLDKERNLVVGIVSQAYHSDPKTLKDHETAWAINARILSFNPFSLSVQDVSLPLRAAPRPEIGIATTRVKAISHPGMKMYGEPPSLSTWVGRNELLQSLSNDWNNPGLHVTGLIGFGGEGKSSLARHWLDTLLQDTSQRQPDGIFWWNFYESSYVVSFFEAVRLYLRGDQANSQLLKKIQGIQKSGQALEKVLQEWAGEQARVLGATLSAGRYLFILDGLEVMQYQEGDQYGLLKDDALCKFLEYLAAPGHESFGLITSRVPMLDLIDYTTYTHQDVGHLSHIDGIALLRQLGVSGTDAALGKVVADWGGYALVLSLIGTYVVEKHGGNVANINEIPVPAEDDSRYERVYRILHSYDEHLTEAERAFLMLFSAFRRSIDEQAFVRVFRTRTNELDRVISALDDAAFSSLTKHLMNYRILSYDSQTHLYTTHVLIRAHYLKHLNALPKAQVRTIHLNLAKYYLSLVPKTKLLKSDLASLIPGLLELLLIRGKQAMDPTLSVFARIASFAGNVALKEGMIIFGNLLTDEFFREFWYHARQAAIRRELDTQLLLE